MKNNLQALINEQKIVVSDGAMATELEKMGVQTDNELWSAMALIKDPDAIQAVHESYLMAGAAIATTNTYQANLPALVDFGVNHDQGIALIKQAVAVAKQACAGDPAKLIAGSVGPYGAYLADGSEYTGNYALTSDEYQQFHLPRIQALVDAGVDFLALETMPNFAEVKAIVDLLTDQFPTVPVWVSFSVGNQPDRLCDGTPLNQATGYFNRYENVVAIGVNCTTMTNITPALDHIAPATTKPIVVYPNNGDIYDPVTKTWQAVVGVPQFKDLVPEWIERGAQIIGGCCRTTPADIASIKQTVEQVLH